MDTGATRSCMNYNTFMKPGNGNLRQKGTPTVAAADGGNRHNHLRDTVRKRHDQTRVYSVYLP